jgi:hypothetical protein
MPRNSKKNAFFLQNQTLSLISEKSFVSAVWIFLVNMIYFERFSLYSVLSSCPIWFEGTLHWVKDPPQICVNRTLSPFIHSKSAQLWRTCSKLKPVVECPYIYLCSYTMDVHCGTMNRGQWEKDFFLVVKFCNTFQRDTSHG